MAGIDMKSLMGLVGSDGIEALAKSTKTDKSKVTAVLSDALPVLVGKMSDNASTKDGAASLNKALNEHKTGDVIDAASFLQGADSDDGKKILGHILGDDEDAATKAISRKSGVSGKKVGTILSMVAPLLLSQLGNKKDDDEADSSALGGLLGGLLGGGSQSSSGSIGSTLLGSLLGGGSSSQQSSSGGLFGGLLGGLLGGKEEEKEEEKEESPSILGGLSSLAMGLFGDSSALNDKEESTSGKKKTGKKTGTTSAKKKTGTTSTGKKTAAKKPASSTGKKTGTTSTGKKTAAKKPASSTAKKTGTTSTGKKTAKKTTGK